MLAVLKSHYKSFSRFSFVGVLNTLLDFAAFFVFYNLFGFWFVVAHVSAFAIALANSFIFNALWTFKNLKRDQLIRQVSAFVVIGLIGLACSTVVLFVAQPFMHVYFAKILAMVVSLAWNYVGSWFFVFKD